MKETIQAGAFTPAFFLLKILQLANIYSQILPSAIDPYNREMI